MPGLDRRSSRWCCTAHAHALGRFHEEIIPSDVNAFRLKRRASPLLAPSTEGGPRHDRALLHHILKDQQSKQRRVEILSTSHNAESQAPVQALQQDGETVKLPAIPVSVAQADKHKGISNGKLHLLHKGRDKRDCTS